MSHRIKLDVEVWVLVDVDDYDEATQLAFENLTVSCDGAVVDDCQVLLA